jgi:hypothetical protein
MRACKKAFTTKQVDPATLMAIKLELPARTASEYSSR